MTDETNQKTTDVGPSALSDGLELARVMRSAEQIMRDDNRRAGKVDAARMHGDRAQMLSEFIDALLKERSNAALSGAGTNPKQGAAD